MRTDWAYRLGWTAACRVPAPLVRPALDRVADTLWRRRGKGVLRLEANLARAVPAATALDPEAMRELSRSAMRSYLRYWGEVFRLPRWSARDILDCVDTEGFHHLRDAHAAGRGVVGALPHMGNWDLAGAWSCAMGIPLTAVAERLQPESLYREFLAFREGLGMEILPITGGEPTMPTLTERLESGGFVCLLADRDLSRSGIEIELLGSKARFPRGPAVLAQRTGALLIPVTSVYDDGVMRLRLHEPVPVQEGSDGVTRMTQQIADTFGEVIREYPQDWHMLQRVFVEDVTP